MDKETLVYVDLDGVPNLMGRLWARVRKNKESATFEYDDGWLQHPARFSLEPALQLGPGPFHTPAYTPMFGEAAQEKHGLFRHDLDAARGHSDAGFLCLGKSDCFPEDCVDFIILARKLRDREMAVLLDHRRLRARTTEFV